MKLIDEKVRMREMETYEHIAGRKEGRAEERGLRERRAGILEA